MYPSRLGDRYTTGLGAETNYFLSFLFSVAFHQKINDFKKHLIFRKWLTEDKNAERREKQRKKKKKTCRRERSNRQRKCFHSFKYITDT